MAGSPGIGGPSHAPPTIGFALPPGLGMGDDSSGGNQQNSPADEAVFENPPTAWGQYWAGVGQVFSGYGKAATGVVSGGYQMVRHPIQTAQGLATAAANPVATAKVIIAEYKQKAQTLEGQGDIVGEILIDIALGGVGKALGEGAKASKLGKALSKVADDVPSITDDVASASGRRYGVPNGIVQDEVEYYITTTYREFEEAGGTVLDRWNELGPLRDNRRTLARTNLKDKTIMFYKGAEFQDVVEELLHFKQAQAAGVWGRRITPEIAAAWEGQVETLFGNLGMTPLD